MEIGVGTGQTIFWFEQEGFDVEGIEPDGESVRLVNSILKKGRVTESTIEDFNTKKTYDVIWMSHVLEHIRNPINFLKKIQENLKTNGIFFIEVPNCENSKMRNVSIQKAPHVLHFTVKSLSEMVRLADYEIIKCDTFRPATKIEGLKQKIFKNSFGFIRRITAPITVAPRIELGRYSRRNANGRASKTNAPVIAPDHVEVAPAKWFNALLPKEPPTGNACEIAEARLATP